MMSSLLEKFGAQPWAPDYIMVYRRTHLLHRPEILESRVIYRKELFSYSDDNIDYVVVLMSLNSRQRHSSGPLHGFKLIPNELMYAADVIIALGGNKDIRYVKDRSGFAMGVGKEAMREIFNADLIKWLKHMLAR